MSSDNLVVCYHGAMDAERKCNTCNVTKPIEDFPTDRRPRKSTGEPGRLRHCRDCHLKRQRKRSREKYDPRAKRDRYLRQRYGISLERFEAILESQGGVCAICGEAQEHKRSGRPYLHAQSAKPVESVTGRWCVDHDHEHCGPDKGCAECVRGVLCTKCNTAIGSLGTVENMQAAINYLRRW